MSIKINDYILQQDNAVSKEWCDEVIDYFKSVQSISRAKSAGISPLKQDNKIYFLNNRERFKTNLPLLRDFNNAIQLGLDNYVEKYPMLNEVSRFTLNTDVKVQATQPGEGYHEWHCEQDGLSRSERLLLCMIYLNDVEEGGETEWLNQHLRIRPKCGRLVICPAFWTHFHRGNPPINGVKYMINGWMEFVDG